MKKAYTIKWRWLTLALASATLWLGSCQKEVTETPQPAATATEQLSTSRMHANPYSLRNVRKARRRLAQQQSTQSQTTATAPTATAVDGYPRYVYFSFKPDDLPSELFRVMENDSTVRLLDFPFANPKLYDENFVLDENNKAGLEDGNIYGVTSLQNQKVLDLLQSAASTINTQFLDTLVLVPESETDLQRQAMSEAGGSPAQQALFGICLLKQPSGFVRYQDNELGRLEPVRGMEVWALVFGVPVWTHTDANGRYNIPWRFSAGTIMGTKAINNRVKVKPFNTMGGFVAVTAQLVTNFIVGSVHTRGTVSSCDMRNDVNFEFRDHRQNRYWSQILNAYWFQAQFAAQSGVLPAPDNMVAYAHWADEPGFGRASTPMLYHLSGGQFTGVILQNIFGNPVTGTLARLLQEMLPDMTFKVCGGTAPFRYESQLTHTAFHELGHASMYRKAGAGWWLDVVVAEISNNYGNPGYNNWGKVQIAESWAEYIGTDFAARRYPNGVKGSRQFNAFIQCSRALEEEEWYAEPTEWIPNGVYFDLIDVTNADPAENIWDRVGGSNISQMYQVFNSGTTNICQFREDFINRYPQFNAVDVRALFAQYNVSCQ